MIMLEKLIQFAQVWPALIMKIAITNARYDKNTSIRKNPLVAYYLCRKRLHHLDGVCTHSIAIVKVRGHAENNHIIFLFRPMYIGALISHFPADGLHLLGPSGVDLNLPRPAV